jgi:hypothetical protein
MDSTPALRWLGIDQWMLRVPLPGYSETSDTPLEADDSPRDTPALEQDKAPEDSSVAAVPVPAPLKMDDLCFIAANGGEFSALVTAISRCVPSGKTAVHQPADAGGEPSVQLAGQTWSISELRRSGLAKRTLWRLLVGSKA